jgi:hypothetical protein
MPKHACSISKAAETAKQGSETLPADYGRAGYAHTEFDLVVGKSEFFDEISHGTKPSRGSVASVLRRGSA